MASPLTLQSDQPGARRARVPALRQSGRTRLDNYPRSPLLRWSLRFTFAVPFLFFGFVSARSGLQVNDTPNAQLLAHVAQIPWNRADAGWLEQISPPLSTFAAALLLPGGRVALSIVGALAAGILLQKIFEIMVQRRFPVSTAVILTLALEANPLFAFTVIENLPGFLGLAFFGLGLADMMRFVVWGNTQSGFRAGIYFLLAMLSDPAGILYVATAAAAAPFLHLGRRGQRGARGANVLVIVYPTAAVVGALALLALIFLHNPLGPFAAQLAGSGQRLAILSVLFLRPEGWLLAAPVVSTWLIAIILRRPGAIAVSTLVFVAILGGYVLGFFPANSAGNTFIVMILMAIALIPTARTPLTNILVDIVAVAQIAIAWLAAFNRPIIVAWMDTVAQGFRMLGH